LARWWIKEKMMSIEFVIILIIGLVAYYGFRKSKSTSNNQGPGNPNPDRDLGEK